MHGCCHWHSRCASSPTHRFFHTSEFSLRARILILLSCCNNSSKLLPVVILHTFCTEEIRHLRCGIYQNMSGKYDRYRCVFISLSLSFFNSVFRFSSSGFGVKCSRLIVSLFVECFGTTSYTFIRSKN